MCPGLVLEWAGRNKLVLEFSAQPYTVAWWLIRPTLTAVALVRIFGEAYLITTFCNGIGVWKRWGVGSRAYVLVTPACSCVE